MKRILLVTCLAMALVGSQFSLAASSDKCPEVRRLTGQVLNFLFPIK